jgi:hypothetical protein
VLLAWARLVLAHCEPCKGGRNSMPSISGALKRTRYYAEVIRFVATKNIFGFRVSDEPWFDSDAAQSLFKDAVSKASTYLEYGSGGSTLFAARYVDTLVTVESDAVFKRAVEREISRSPHKAAVYFLFANIGITGEWGFPVFANKTPSRIEKWKDYPRAPWRVFSGLGKLPEVILIDGRFRVACALESLLRIDHNTRILVDDYKGRDYNIIERFANLLAMHGRMAEFRKKNDFDETDCKQKLAMSYSVLD